MLTELQRGHERRSNRFLEDNYSKYYATRIVFFMTTKYKLKYKQNLYGIILCHWFLYSLEQGDKCSQPPAPSPSISYKTSNCGVMGWTLIRQNKNDLSYLLVIYSENSVLRRSHLPSHAAYPPPPIIHLPLHPLGWYKFPPGCFGCTSTGHDEQLASLHRASLLVQQTGHSLSHCSAPLGTSDLH